MMNERARGAGPWVVLAASVVGGALAWAASLSYGFEGGRYPTWQVVGAVVAVVVVVVLSRALARGRALWATVLGVTAGFAVPWGVWAGRDDETGMYLVGLLMLVVGLLVGATVVSVVADRAVGRPGRRLG